MNYSLNANGVLRMRVAPETTSSNGPEQQTGAAGPSNVQRVEFEPGEINFQQIRHFIVCTLHSVAQTKYVQNLASLYDDGPGGIDQTTIETHTTILKYAMPGMRLFIHPLSFCFFFADDEMESEECTICRSEYEIGVRRGDSSSEITLNYPDTHSSITVRALVSYAVH
jgi:hypothetical protein